MRFLIPIALFSASMLSASASANIVQNGGFEDATAWTFVNVQRSDASVVQPFSGSWSAGTACDGPTCLQVPGGAFFFQTLNTTPGEYYDLSFGVLNNFIDAIPGGEQFQVRWGGQDLGVEDFSGVNWAPFSYTHLLAPGPTTFLVFSGRNDFSGGGIFFDNVVAEVSPAATVPEPSTWMMMLIGFGAIGFGMRRRKATDASIPNSLLKPMRS